MSLDISNNLKIYDGVGTHKKVSNFKVEHA